MTIKSNFIGSLLICSAASAMCSAASARADNGDVDKIKQELDTLRKENQAKVDELDKKLKELQSSINESQQQTQQLEITISQKNNKTAANSFNPSIGVVLNGKYIRKPDDNEFSIPGFMLGEESGPGEAGFSLGESELNFSANIDDKFLGNITVSFGEETAVEEAFLQSTALPSGLTAKFGRFFSAIGYLNSRHSHTDDFASRPLAYQVFLDNSLSDDGVQFSWLAPTSLYWESGVELYRGDSFPAAGAENAGKGVATAFTHIGGDINFSQSWRAGLSYLKAKVSDRLSADEESFSGDSKLLISDFIWKWAPNGNAKNTNAKIQAEYLYRTEEGEFTDSASQKLPLDSDQDGWYVEGVYQFMPQWRMGARYERLTADDLSSVFKNSILDNQNEDLRQTSVMIDWTNSEFSRLRLQYSRDQASPDKADIWTLQYTAAFGAHSAHSF